MGSFINVSWYATDATLTEVEKGWFHHMDIHMRKIKLDFQPHIPSLPAPYTTHIRKTLTLMHLDT